MEFRILKKIFIGLAIVGFSSTAYAAPLILPYSGTIESAGVPVNGSGSFKFAILNSSGETPISLWSNDGTSDCSAGDAGACEPDSAVSVDISNGLFNVGLGDGALTNMSVALTPNIFDNNDIYIRVWFDDGANGFQQMSPDKRLLSAPFALNANSANEALSLVNGATVDATTLEGKHAADFIHDGHTHDHNGLYLPSSTLFAKPAHVHGAAEIGPHVHEAAEIGPHVHEAAEIGPHVHGAAEIGPHIHTAYEKITSSLFTNQFANPVVIPYTQSIVLPDGTADGVGTFKIAIVDATTTDFNVLTANTIWSSDSSSDCSGVGEAVCKPVKSFNAEVINGKLSLDLDSIIHTDESPAINLPVGAITDAGMENLFVRIWLADTDNVFTVLLPELAMVTSNETVSYSISSKYTESIPDSIVTSAKIADASITGADLAPNSVVGGTAGDIQDGTITAADLAIGAVVGGTGGDIMDGSITAADIAANSLGASEIATNAVGSSEISAGAVGTSEIANGSIAGADLSTVLYNEARYLNNVVVTTFTSLTPLPSLGANTTSPRITCSKVTNNAYVDCTVGLDSLNRSYVILSGGAWCSPNDMLSENRPATTKTWRSGCNKVTFVSGIFGGGSISIKNILPAGMSITYARSN